MREDELKELIDRVADRFESSFGIRINEACRDALLSPAVPHLHNVTRDEITKRRIEAAVLKILSNAIDIRGNVDFIDREAVLQSMERDCPYLFWC